MLVGVWMNVDSVHRPAAYLLEIGQVVEIEHRRTVVVMVALAGATWRESIRGLESGPEPVEEMVSLLDTPDKRIVDNRSAHRLQAIHPHVRRPVRVDRIDARHHFAMSRVLREKRQSCSRTVEIDLVSGGAEITGCHALPSRQADEGMVPVCLHSHRPGDGIVAAELPRAIDRAVSMETCGIE